MVELKNVVDEKVGFLDKGRNLVFFLLPLPIFLFLGVLLLGIVKGFVIYSFTTIFFTISVFLEEMIIDTETEENLKNILIKCWYASIIIGGLIDFLLVIM